MEKNIYRLSMPIYWILICVVLPMSGNRSEGSAIGGGIFIASAFPFFASYLTYLYLSTKSDDATSTVMLTPLLFIAYSFIYSIIISLVMDSTSIIQSIIFGSILGIITGFVGLIFASIYLVITILPISVIKNLIQYKENHAK